jgi:site-specific recombinase XerD
MSTAVFFSFPGTRRRMYAGPLGPHVNEFIAWLQEQHYTQHSIRCKIRVVADFSRWLGRHRLGADSAIDEQVQQFLEHRERTSSGEMGDLSALRQMSDMLLRANITQRSPPVFNERELAEQAFCTHLLRDQGVRPTTPTCYLRPVSRFLRGRFGDGPIRFGELASTDVVGFIRRDTRGQSYSRAQQTLTAIRSFLRYLRLRGLITVDLAAGVPNAAHWFLAKLPSFLRASQVTRVLSLCERKLALVDAITRCFCCWHDWVFVPARSLLLGSIRLIGSTVLLPFAVKADNRRRCRFRGTSVRPSQTICRTGDRSALIGVFLSVCMRLGEACAAPPRSR